MLLFVQVHKPSNEHTTATKCLEEAEDQGTEEGSTSETGNDPTIQLIVDLKQKGIKLSVGDITTSVPNARESRSIKKNRLLC
ncbi:hypothetical protein P8452_07493 [Trifolium repens]|nr:hypothetical protein P8452_07493 [Trifolium repens]